MQEKSQGRDIDDTNVGVGQCGGGEKGRQQKLYDQRMREVVHAELELVAVSRQICGEGHDARIADEDVEARGGKIARDRVADGGEGGMVQLDECDLHLWIKIMDLVREFASGSGVATGEIDVRWVVGGDVEDGLVADTRSSASDENDFASKVRDGLDSPVSVDHVCEAIDTRLNGYSLRAKLCIYSVKVRVH